MPSLYNIFGYKIYFWSNENNEPIHVHVCKGNPSPRATKLWITQAGGVITVNSSRIPKKDISKIEQFVVTCIPQITYAWINTFGSVTYYC